jgi:hypothetical protein
MKHGRFFLGFLVFLCAAALFMGCPNEPDDEEEEDVIVKGVQNLDVSVATGEGPKYYSLKTGKEVTDAVAIASKKWDIAFEASRLIYTNSGDTAVGVSSGGQGGVWFTDKTDFADVSAEDKVETTGDYADFTADVTKYISGMGGASASRLNVMTYVGYTSGTGTESEPYTTVPMQGGPPSDDYVPYLYDKKHFVSMTHMMPPVGATYALSNQVYIIKHGDGTHYSKVQITEYASDSGDVLKVKYQNF